MYVRTSSGPADLGAFDILGCVEVAGPGGRPQLTSCRQRALIAALSLQPGVVVPTWRLVEALWGERPPRTAVRSLHSHVARLRLTLDGCGLGGMLQTREPGYVLAVDQSVVDACRFERDVRAGRESLAGGLPAHALEALTNAVSWWRGDALADAEPVGWTAAEAERLEQMRLAALADRCEALICLGRHDDALVEAERLLDLDSNRERPVGLQMIALCGSGRQADALDAYQCLRHRLADELGVDPSPELTDLYTAILRGTAAACLRAPGSVAGQGITVTAAASRPAQLASRVGYFTGRDDEMRALDRAIVTTRGRDRPVVLLCGQGGVGKTALAMQWAHSAIGTFPDGQLFVDVRGHDSTTALRPDEVLAALLRGLSVPDERMPAGMGERIGLYRSLLADKHVLIVLDNAGATEQVVPAIPNCAESMLLVTSRSNLAALVTHAEVRTVVLDVLSEDDSAELLEKMLGTKRVNREREATTRVAQLCGRLPLALRIAAAKLVMEPHRSIHEFADTLSNDDRLTHLGIEDGSRSVEAVLHSTYQAMPASARQMFGLLGLHPGPHFSAPLAAAVCGTTVERQRHALADLLAVHLIAETEPGRYRMHDLVRLFAHKRVLAEEPEDVRLQAAQRLLDWYLVGAQAANRELDRGRDRIAPVLRHAPPPVPFKATREAALGFLESERENLLPIVRFATDHGQPAAACQLTYLLTSFFDVRGNWSQRVQMCRLAVRGARLLGDPAVEAEMHRALGIAYRCAHQLSEALDSHTSALVLLQGIGDKSGLAHVYNNIGGAHAQMRQFEAAIEAYRTALRLHTECAYAAGVAVVHRNLGFVYIRMEQPDLSFEHLNAALTICREIGYRRLEAGVLDSLGEAHLRQERYGKALNDFQAALALSREIGDRSAEMDALDNLGLTHLARGDAVTAVRLLGEALTTSRLLAHQHAEARILNHRGEAHLSLIDVEAAGRDLHASLRLRHALPDPYEEARLHRNLADLAQLNGDTATAESRRQTAIALFRKANALGEAERLANSAYAT